MKKQRSASLGLAALLSVGPVFALSGCCGHIKAGEHCHDLFGGYPEYGPYTEADVKAGRIDKNHRDWNPIKGTWDHGTHENHYHPDHAEPE